MPNGPNHPIACRLDRLEREVRWWRVAGGFGLAALLMIGAAPQVQVPEKLVAKGLELLDDSGKPRGTWRVFADGSSVLALLNADGKPRAVLGASPNGDPQFGLLDVSGAPRALLAFDDGLPTFLLKDGSGKNRIALTVQPDGRPALALQDAQEKGLAAFFVGPDGYPRLTLRDTEHRRRVSLDVDSSGGAVALADANQTPRAVFGAFGARAESSAVLLDKDGKVLWKAP